MPSTATELSPLINLANKLPAERHAALHQEFDLLDRTLEKLYVLPEDLARRAHPGFTRTGGSTEIKSPKWVI
jgi:hypothetical protein